ncbi:MAG: CAP domain-containing protein [Chloroflexota bacterium]
MTVREMNYTYFIVGALALFVVGLLTRLFLFGYSETSISQAANATIEAMPTQTTKIFEVTQIVEVIQPVRPDSSVQIHEEIEATPSPDNRSPSHASVEQANTLLSSEQRLLFLLNEERRKYGLPGLSPSPLLAQAARRHSQDMAVHNLTSHLGSDESGVHTRVEETGYLSEKVGELLAFVYPEASEALSGWLTDATFRPILLSDEFTDIGISHVSDPQSFYHHYWTLTFARPQSRAEQSRVAQVPTDASLTLVPLDTPSALPTDRSALSAKRPTLTVSEELVNLRAGPGIEYVVVGLAERDMVFTIIGRNADSSWWKICCFDELEAWIIAQFVSATVGSTSATNQDELEKIPVIEVPKPTATLVEPENSAPASTPTQVPTQEPTQTPTPQVQPTPPGRWPFKVVTQVQHVEANFPAIYAWVQAGHSPLDGYFLRVQKDGQFLGMSKRSTPLSLGTTKPAFPEHPDNRDYNIKMSFDHSNHPELSPIGLWQIQLIDGVGELVSQSVQFTIQPNDQLLEMYVHFRM